MADAVYKRPRDWKKDFLGSFGVAPRGLSRKGFQKWKSLLFGARFYWAFRLVLRQSPKRLKLSHFRIWSLNTRRIGKVQRALSSWSFRRVDIENQRSVFRVWRDVAYSESKRAAACHVLVARLHSYQREWVAVASLWKRWVHCKRYYECQKRKRLASMVRSTYKGCCRRAFSQWNKSLQQIGYLDQEQKSSMALALQSLGNVLRQRDTLRVSQAFSSWVLWQRQSCDGALLDSTRGEVSRKLETVGGVLLHKFRRASSMALARVILCKWQSFVLKRQLHWQQGTRRSHCASLQPRCKEWQKRAAEKRVRKENESQLRQIRCVKKQIQERLLQIEINRKTQIAFSALLDSHTSRAARPKTRCRLKR